MKNINIVLCMLTMLVVTHTQAQQFTKAEIVATGLTCSMCSNAINKQLKSIPSVASVDIDLNNNLFIVTLTPNNTLTPADLKDKVEKAGFFVGSFFAYLNLGNLSITENKQVDAYTFIDAKPQTITGTVKVQVINKGYVTAKAYKKLQQEYNKNKRYTKDNNKSLYVKLI